MGLKSRITKIEAKVGGKAPVEFVCTFSGDPEAEQKKQKAIEAYHRKYGSLENLTFICTHCPEPLPLPEGLRPAKQSI